jgi:hypothetical protein
MEPCLIPWLPSAIIPVTTIYSALNFTLHLRDALEIKYSAFGKSLCPYKRYWKRCPRASIQAWTRLILFANTFCRSACEMFLMYAVIAVFNSLSVRGWSQYRSLSAEWLSKRTVFCVMCYKFDWSTMSNVLL